MLWPTFQNVPQQACLLHRQGFPGPLERLLLFACVRIDRNAAPLLGLCFPVLLVCQDLSLAGWLSAFGRRCGNVMLGKPVRACVGYAATSGFD